MAEYISQIQEFLRSQQTTASFHDPNNQSQAFDVEIMASPEHPAGWPENLPDPVVLKSPAGSGAVYFTDDQQEKYS